MNRELRKRGKIKLLGLVAAMLLVCPRMEAEAAGEMIYIDCNELENGDYYKNDVITHTYYAVSKSLNLAEGYTFFLYNCTGKVDIVNNNGTLKDMGGTVGSIKNFDSGIISGGRYSCSIDNQGTIEDGFFSGHVDNDGLISGGNFSHSVTNNADGTIKGGTFNIPEGGLIKNNGTIEGGTFPGDGKLENNGTIKGGVFPITGNGTVENNGTIESGTFPVQVNNNSDGKIKGGDFQQTVTNNGTIEDGSYNKVTNTGTIKGGTFNNSVDNKGAGTIKGGTYSAPVYNNGSGTIKGGTFNSSVNNKDTGTIEDGTFNYSVDNNGTGTIKGGTFKATVNNNDTGIIENGTFESAVINNNTGTIKNGTFENQVINQTGTIENGTFKSGVVNYNGIIKDGIFQGTVENHYKIEGGTFSGRFINDNSGSIEGCTLAADCMLINSNGTIKSVTLEDGAKITGNIQFSTPGTWLLLDGKFVPDTGGEDTPPVNPDDGDNEDDGDDGDNSDNESNEDSGSDREPEAEEPKTEEPKVEEPKENEEQIFVRELVESLADVKAGDTKKIDATLWHSFNRSVLEEMLSKEGVSYTLYYNYRGECFYITIPAGAKLEKDCEWYGPLKLNAMFGRTMIDVRELNEAINE